MKINFNFDFGRKEKDVKEMSNVNLAADYINYAVRVFYKDGLESQFRRIWARTQRKLDELTEKKSEIELEQSELDFIKRAVKEAKIPSDLAKYFVVLEDALEIKI